MHVDDGVPVFSLGSPLSHQSGLCCWGECSAFGCLSDSYCKQLLAVSREW